jgi:F5/8 type C domain-containing protein/cell wall-active antibiotic response 4TMS protein YvqF
VLPEVEMTQRVEVQARARRQERVGKVVWGSLFVVMGVLFTLHDMGRIDLRPRDKGLTPGFAVDGDTATRWSSDFSDPQWLAVDLGEVSQVRRVKLYWEGAHAKDYRLEVSSDGRSWTTVRTMTAGDGDVDEHEVDATARYVRMYGTKRATPWGYSLWEFQVYGPSDTLLSQGKPATASSLEGFGPFAHWALFWPVLMVGAGLPLLLAPRDDSNQLLGLVLTAVGTFFQLQHLGVVTWGFREVSSVLLIVVGVLVLLQSLRGSSRPDAPTGGPESGR